MLQQAAYTNGHRTLTASVERHEVLLKSEEPLNFPRIIELEGDRLVLAYGRGRHGGDETRHAAFSEDGGKTWADFPPDSPWSDNVQTSGVLGYLVDGTIAYVDVFPLETAAWTRDQGPWFDQRIENPTWRLRRFSKSADLLEDTAFHVLGLPWKATAYYCYGDLLHLENGDLLIALGAQTPDRKEPGVCVTTFFARSTDGGTTFEFLCAIDPEIDGRLVGPEGLNEPTMAVLGNGEILCVMRTGGFAPLHQSRSQDGGHTWSTPVSTGWPADKPALRLMGNGVLACSSGRGTYGRPQITHAMFSLDGTGEVWEVPFAFHTGPGCSYTSNMERDGKLYVAYSHSSFGTPAGTFGLPYQSIKWVVLDVALSD